MQSLVIETNINRLYFHVYFVFKQFHNETCLDTKKLEQVPRGAQIPPAGAIS